MSWGYWELGGWIVILGLYLSNAFERINQLEERLNRMAKKLEPKD